MAKVKKYRGQSPRRLTEEDVGEWVNIDFRRKPGEPPKPVTVEQLRLILQTSNPLRWWQMRRDFKWAQKQLLKAGYDPEEVRWLL